MTRSTVSLHTVVAVTPSLRSPWLAAFGVAAIAQLTLIVARLPAWFAVVSTWIVVPLLAVWVWRVRGPKLLVVALAFFWAGDVLGNPRLIGLGPSALFVGIAAYAIAGVLLIVVFARAGATTAIRAAGRRWRAGLGLPILAAAAIALAVTWSDLGLALRVFGVVYLLIRVAMATAAFLMDLGAGVGGAILFASQLLVALEIGGRIDGTATAFRLAYWTLYLLGLLVVAVRTAMPRPPAAEPRER
jgi:hypothetical protein